MGTVSSTQLSFNVRSTLVEAFRQAAVSGYPTMLPDDKFLVDKLAYKTADPKRGDIIVFLSPQNRRLNYIERVVAVAGDTVEIRNGDLYINDQKLQRQMLPQSALENLRIKIEGQILNGDIFEESNGSAKYKIFLAKPPFDKTSSDFAKITVPQYHCFVLGDNRYLSEDSRNFGPIPLATIKGKADYLYWPVKGWSRIGPLN